MSNTIDTHSNADVMKVFIRHSGADFNAIDGVLEDNIVTVLRPFLFSEASAYDLLTKIKFPNVTTLGSYCFSGLRSTTEIDIDWSKITTIGNYLLTYDHSEFGSDVHLSSYENPYNSSQNDYAASLMEHCIGIHGLYFENFSFKASGASVSYRHLDIACKEALEKIQSNIGLEFITNRPITSLSLDSFTALKSFVITSNVLPSTSLGRTNVYSDFPDRVIYVHENLIPYYDGTTNNYGSGLEIRKIEDYPNIVNDGVYYAGRVRYWNYNGTTLYQSEVVYNGAAPVQSAPMGKGALGWSTSMRSTEATANIVYTGLTGDLNLYEVFAGIVTVSLYDDEGTLISSTEVAIGDDYTPPSPTKTGNSIVTYDFAGWSSTLGGTVEDISFTNIQDNIVAYAVFDEMYVSQVRNLVSGKLRTLTNSTLTSMSKQYIISYQDNLTSVVFSGLTTVGVTFIISCDVLTSVSLPVLETISNAIMMSVMIEDLYLPEVTSITNEAIVSLCSSLKKVRLPKLTGNIIPKPSTSSNIEFIDIGFASGNINYNSTYYKKLKYLVLRNTSGLFGVSVALRSDCPITQGTGKILVPSDLVADYKADSSWSAYSSIIEAIENNTALAGGNYE